MFKSLGRIGLFLISNIAIMLVLSTVAELLGVRNYISAQGLQYEQLLGFSLVIGMGGALISLATSRLSARWLMGVKIIDPLNAGQYADLLRMVHDISKRAGISTMPQVGVFESSQPNAFATGPTRNRAMVAVSTGLLRVMNKEQLEGVIAHEVAHIQNGDMVTMTLLQGVLNTFVIFLARVISFVVGERVKEENRALVSFATRMILEILLGFLASMLTAWFSRRREFRADAGAARLVGRAPMRSALEVLRQRYEAPGEAVPASLAAFQISSGKTKSFLSLFATHPPLEERIHALDTAEFA